MVCRRRSDGSAGPVVVAPATGRRTRTSAEVEAVVAARQDQRRGPDLAGPELGARADGVRPDLCRHGVPPRNPTDCDPLTGAADPAPRTDRLPSPENNLPGSGPHGRQEDRQDPCCALEAHGSALMETATARPRSGCTTTSTAVDHDSLAAYSEQPADEKGRPAQRSCSAENCSTPPATASPGSSGPTSLKTTVLPTSHASSAPPSLALNARQLGFLSSPTAPATASRKRYRTCSLNGPHPQVFSTSNHRRQRLLPLARLLTAWNADTALGGSSP